MTTRREWLGTVLRAGAVALAGAVPLSAAALGKTEITVYKSPTCGCCTKWLDHLTANGFTVKALDTEDVAAVKRSLGVPKSLESCHTGVVAGYAIEGHVPAAEIKQLLRTRPRILGLAVPGMPHGTPGMETGRMDRYDVVAFSRDGKTSVFSRH